MASSAKNPQQTRRDFISKTLKMTAGAYVGMNIIENFVGPKIGSNGMPVHAATMANNDVPPSDVPPSDVPPSDIPPSDIPPGHRRRSETRRARRARGHRRSR